MIDSTRLAASRCRSVFRRTLAGLFVLLVAASCIRAADDFPQLYNSEDEKEATPLPPAQAAAQMQLPEGFRAAVFAAEPDVQNPIAMTWDARGRLWVAENYTYAEREIHFDLELRDRVLVFDDSNGDGRFDSRTVFSDNVQMLTSIEVGRGGVWLMCPPRLLFIPDADADAVPDGPAEVVLDGFTVAEANYHNFANGLHWGPDGWLYGRCGHSCPGFIGRPGASDDERRHLGGGVWRYHPETKHVEVLTTGTTNPWGHDWDEHGECFFINTVNGHLWHMIPGAHFVQSFSLDPNPYIYQPIDQHADHFHFDTGENWTASRDGAADSYGGGHAHIGAMIYLGDTWPQEYRGRLFTLNMHGRRANQEILERSGSGYVAHHAPDFLLSADQWFRGMELSYGPDGGVFVFDWSDTGECHEHTGVHRESGRIFKITYGDPKQPANANLRDMSVRELAGLQTAENEWFARQARLVLTERAANGEPVDEAAAQLREQFEAAGSIALKLRALFCLYQLGLADEAFLHRQLNHENEHIRAWAIRLLTDHWPIDDITGLATHTRQSHPQVYQDAMDFVPMSESMARSDESGLVRLVIGSTLQRLPVEARPAVAIALTSRSEDAYDHNLPLLVWYGMIAVAQERPELLVDVLEACRWPKTRELIARRLTEDLESRPEPVERMLSLVARSDDLPYQKDILHGVSDALRGWSKAAMPASWDAVVAASRSVEDEELRNRVRELSVVFGDGRALSEVKQIALDSEAGPQARRSALETLIQAKHPDLIAICEELVGDRQVGVLAAQGLATSDDPDVGARLVNAYRKSRPIQRPSIIAILVSRPEFAAQLLDAVRKGQVPPGALSAYDVRQLHSLNDPSLSQTVREVWGEIRDTPEAKREAIEQLKAELTDAALREADLSRGRALFNTSCAQCHRMYGEGAGIGPDLTGSDRSNLDYLLENIIDPSAVVNKDFRMTVLVLESGRVLNGLVTEESDRTITLQSPTELHVIDKSEVEDRRITPLSPMPDGILDTLPPEDVRNLIGYLKHPNQVPLPAGVAPLHTQEEAGDSEQ